MPRRGHDVLRGRVLGHERGRPGLERLEELVVAGVHREDDDADLRVLGAHLAAGVEAVAVGQAHVEDHDVGVEQREQTTGVAQRAGLTDDLEVAVSFEGPAQALADELVVVDEEHRDRHAAPPLWPCRQSR